MTTSRSRQLDGVHSKSPCKLVSGLYAAERMPLLDLKKLASTDSSFDWVLDQASNLELLEVSTSHALTKAAGYLKFIYRKESNILFRGQSRMHPRLPPSLFRETTKSLSFGGMSKRAEKLRSLMSGVAATGGFIPSTPPYAHEPLLQHYGIRTRWLDVVDNLWIALWFAAHRAIGWGRNVPSTHFERRRVGDPKDTGYCYILLIRAPGFRCRESEPGLFKDADLQLIDLRKATPSTYVRPHAQHGLLIRKHLIQREDDNDFMPFVVGIIRVRLIDALDWIGNSMLLSVHSLFPPPYYDWGYARLLEAEVPPTKPLGAISIISP